MERDVEVMGRIIIERERGLRNRCVRKFKSLRKWSCSDNGMGKWKEKTLGCG